MVWVYLSSLSHSCLQDSPKGQFAVNQIRIIEQMPPSIFGKEYSHLFPFQVHCTSIEHYAHTHTHTHTHIHTHTYTHSHTHTHTHTHSHTHTIASLHKDHLWSRMIIKSQIIIKFHVIKWCRYVYRKYMIVVCHERAFPWHFLPMLV